MRRVSFTWDFRARCDVQDVSNRVQRQITVKNDEASVLHVRPMLLHKVRADASEDVHLAYYETALALAVDYHCTS